MKLGNQHQGQRIVKGASEARRNRKKVIYELTPLGDAVLRAEARRIEQMLAAARRVKVLPEVEEAVKKL